MMTIFQFQSRRYDMAKRDRLLACMSFDELADLLKKTRIRTKGKNIAFDVLVKGMDISSVARNHQVSEQWVLNLCNRIKDLKINSNSVKISVTLPASIAPQAQQILTGLKEVYELGLNEGEKA